jgi:hypothetical protein
MLVVLVFVLLAIDPPTVLMILGLAYVVSGVVVTILGRQQWKSRRERRAAKRDGPPDSEPGTRGPGEGEP